MTIPVLLTVSVGLLLTVDNRKERTAKELDKLKGEWVLVETVDEKRPHRGDDSIRMVIEGKAVTMKLHGLTTNQGTIEIKFSERATLIDMRFGAGTIWRGRYELDGDQLTLCFDEAGNKRPNSLAPKGTQWIEKWRRVKL